MPMTENEEFEFRARAEAEATSTTPEPTVAPAKPAVPTPPPPEDTHARRMGLVGRYALETVAAPALMIDDVAQWALNKVQPSTPAEVNAHHESVSQKFSSALTSLGFPSPETKREKSAEQLANIGLLAVGAGSLVKNVGVPLAKKALGKLGEAEKVSQGLAKAEVGQAQAAHEAAAMKADQVARREKQAADSAAAKRKKVQADIDKPISPTDSHNTTGTTLRGILDSTMSEAQSARTVTGNELFKEAAAAAEKKEASGKYISTKSVVAPIDELLKDTENIPKLNNELLQIKQALSSSPGTKKTLLIDTAGKPLAQGEAEGAKPFTFAKAEILRRYLNDIAYSTELEGFSGIGKRAARDAVKALDAEMTGFTPEFAKYKNTYAEMSKPLEAMETKLGRMAHGTEGGIKADSYSKVPAQDLPKAFFSKQDNINTLVDMLAGGKNATPVARAEAEQQVQAMAMKFYKEEFRNLDPAAALKKVKSPEMRGSMEAMPKVESALTKGLTHRVGQAEKVKSLAETEKAALESQKAAEKLATKHKEVARSLKESMFQGDSILATGDKAAPQIAYKKYLEGFDKARAEGAISDAQYKVVMQAMSRVRAETSKAALMKEALKSAVYMGFGYGAFRGVSIAGEAVGGH